MRLGRQVRGDGEALPRFTSARMGGHQPVVLEERHRGVGGAHPQALAHQREGHGVEDAIVLHVAVAVHGEAVPTAQIRGDGWKCSHQRLLYRKAIQRLLAGGAVHAKACFFEHPAPGLGVEIGQIAKLPDRQEVPLHVLHARFDDALLLRVGGRTGVDPESVALSTFGIGALHHRIVNRTLA